MANQDYGELFCQAVDEIVKKRLEGISYDTTILCTIIDDTNRDKGLYIVSNGGSKFEAVSAVTSYRNNNTVYVQIPGGDMNEQKIIIAKKTDKTEDPYVYREPFSTLVDVTGNLIKTQIDSTSTGLIANAYTEGFKDPYNDLYQAITLWTYNSYDEDCKNNEEGPAQSSYTRLGIQAGFQSWLNPFYAEDNIPRRVIDGEYGLRLRIYAVDEKVSTDKKKKESVYDMYLNCYDMNGNPYNFQTFYEQEKVFDISAVGQIEKMELQFYQKPGTFVDENGIEIPFNDFLGNYIAPNLYVKDPYITLGYDISQFDEEMVHIYTLDSTTFTATANPLTNNHKEIHLRWIHQLDDGTFMSITDETKYNYEVRWYRYQLGAPSADEYSGVYWKNLSKQVSTEGEHIYTIQDDAWKLENKKCEPGFKREPGFFSSWLIPDVTLQNEQIKAIILFNGKPYRSNILKCENEREVVNKATVDAVQALSINCGDDTYGNYRIYNNGNSLIDHAQASIEREFIPYFKSSSGTGEDIPTELIEAEKIEWIIPTQNTMIVLKDEFTSGATPTTDTDGRIHIVRTGSGFGGNELNGRNRQKYLINGYYSQNKSDNTIQCKITKNNTVYTATKELTFGVAGTTGTDYTFIIDFDAGQTAVTNVAYDAITVTARVYDYENKEITDLANRNITWTWKNPNNTVLTNSPDELLEQRAIPGNTAKNVREIRRLSTTMPTSGASYNILQASLTWGDWDLVAYLPIPIRSSTDYAYMSGTTQVIYNSAGEILDYFKNPFALYKKDATEVSTSSIAWEVLNGNSNEGNYSPKISTGRDGLEYLTPLSFYVEGACEKVCVVGKIGSAVVWSQPLLIIQNRYPSAMINEWDGNLSVGTKDPGTILAPRMAAGKKNTDNTFSGVMMGDWEPTNSSSELTGGTGLYGYHHGEQSFAFRDDGTAFIGKSGVGRISFNGTSGKIESSSFKAGQGMQLDLTSGEINAHQFKLNAGGTVETGPTAGLDNTIFLSSHSTDTYPLQIGSRFYVDWQGNLTANNASFENGNFSGDITGSTIIGGEIYVPSKASPSFSVNTAGTLTATGADIEGAINATSLTCEYGTIGGWTISKTSLQGGTTILNSDGSISNGSTFTVSSSGTLTASGATITGTINAEKGHIGGWTIEESAGTDGDTRGWNAIYASSGGYYTFLDPSRDNVIAVGIPSSNFKKDHNSAKFRVTSDGKMYATDADIKGAIEATTLKCDSGTIGGWTISATGLSASGVSISPSGGITGGITIDNAKITNATISSGTIGGITISSGSLAGTGWSLTSDGATFSSLRVGEYEFVKKTLYYGYYSYGYDGSSYVSNVTLSGDSEKGYTLNVTKRGFKWITRKADVVGANVYEEDD